MMRSRVVRKTIIIILICLSAAACAAVLLFALYDNGIITLNDAKGYEVRGVDVSSYQGRIDWDVLAESIDFAYIKATEGSSSVDPCFEYNLKNSAGKDIRTGAYHFFSFDSSGSTQADNFISNVPVYDNMLPPAIDVEFYGNKESSPPDKAKVVQELEVMIDKLFRHYGVMPVIYSTGKAYDMYISGGFSECDIWIRNIIFYPSLPDRDGWTFWQYSEKGQLDGYSGDERFIDMNVFCGSREEFRKYGV